MTISPANTCAVGDSRLTPLLQRFLHDIDRPGRVTYCFDDVMTMAPWPDGARDHFLKLGMLKEVEPSELIWLHECYEPDWVEPIWLPDESKGGRMIGFYHCRFGCGIHEVELERCKQWAPDWDGIVAAVTAAAQVHGNLVVDVPGRVILLGSAHTAEGSRNVFLLRGTTWKDAPTVLAQAKRLAASRNPIVLCANKLPSLAQLPTQPHAMLSLYEIGSISDARLSLPPDWLQADPRSLVPVPSGQTEHALTAEDVDVLEALSERPQEPLAIVDLMVAAGYGKKAIRASLARLQKQGLVGRPAGTERKGVIITEAGSVYIRKLTQPNDARKVG